MAQLGEGCAGRWEEAPRTSHGMHALAATRGQAMWGQLSQGLSDEQSRQDMLPAWPPLGGDPRLHGLHGK